MYVSYWHEHTADGQRRGRTAVHDWPNGVHHPYITVLSSPRRTTNVWRVPNAPGDWNCED